MKEAWPEPLVSHSPDLNYTPVTVMKYEQYLSLIQTLEESAKNSPRSYRLKVLMLTGLGYGYFVGLIILLLIPVVTIPIAVIAAPEEFLRIALVLGKFVWIILPGIGLYFGFLGSAIRSVTAKVPDPEGREIFKKDAPELFEFIQKTCSDLRASRPKRVLITDSFNAAIATMPRIGIFGRKVILLVGLPLMKTLSPEQFESVIVHEIGHISGKHGAFTKWAYQMREAWGRLIDSQEAIDHKFGDLYKRFVNWFFPYFNGYSFVLMREHEKDADREAANLIGVRPFGEALIRMETKGRELAEEFWVQIHNENLSSEEPSERLFSRMLGSLSSTNLQSATTNLVKAVAVPTDFEDTHPSLSERLRLIGYWPDGELPQLPGPIEIDAATKFLGSLAGLLSDEFDKSWHEQAELTWRERHSHFQQSSARKAELDERSAQGELTLDELRELGRIVNERDGLVAARPYFDEAARRFPNEGVVWFDLGLAKLSVDDESGLEDLDKAMNLDVSLVFEANQLALAYLRGRGRFEESKKYAGAIDAQQEIVDKAQLERRGAGPQDEWEPHNLPREFIESVPRKLSGMDEITVLFVAHKKLSYFPEIPFRVMWIELRPKQKNDANASNVLEIVSKRLNTGEISHFFIVDPQWKGVMTQLEQMPNAKIYGNP